MTAFQGLTEETIQFLVDLEANNERDWFQAQKARYKRAFEEPAKALVTALGRRLQEDISEEIHAEPRVNGSIFRLQRDTRFSKDKTPYKAHLDLMFWQGEGRSREKAAYFFRLTPTHLTLGAGKHAFSKEELTRYREAVDTAGESLEALAQELRGQGYRVDGSHYKRVPKGFAKDHPHEALLRHNGLHAWHESEHPDALDSPAFVEHCLAILSPLAPMMTWLHEQVID